jgi:hypothetical protein
MELLNLILGLLPLVLIVAVVTYLVAVHRAQPQAIRPVGAAEEEDDYLFDTVAASIDPAHPLYYEDD